MSEDEIRDQIKAKPEPVQEVIKMWAVKLSDHHPMETGEQIAYWAKRGLEQWNDIAAEFLLAGVTEEEMARALLQRFRSDPESTWGRILRENHSMRTQ